MPSDEPAAFSKLAEELIGDFRGVPFQEPRRQKKRPTKDLSVLVEQLLQKYQIGRDAPEHTIRARWSEVVGPANAAYAHAVQIDARGRLLVLVSHSVVRNELFHHRKTIVERLRQLPGCDHVRDLLLRAG
jgi:hypothetical protein